MSDSPGKAVARHTEDPEGQLPTVQVLTELLKLERERVAISTLQAEVAREALAVTDKENQRRYEFNDQRVTQDHEHRTRRWGSRTKMIWTGMVVGILLLAVLPWAAFLGDDGQRTTALTLAGYFLSGGAGLGVGYVLGSRART